MPYGVDLNRFCLPSSSAAPHPFRFLFVGLINARKGIPLLLDAWRRVHKLGGELWLVGPIGDAARRMISDLPGLHVLGRKPHNKLPAIFAQCDVFVFPTFFEGFGLVLLEALASGLQVITTTATAAHDIIADPRVGTIMTPGDCEALVEAMEAAQTNADDRPQLARLARQEAERWSWKVYGDRWANMLGEVLNVPKEVYL